MDIPILIENTADSRSLLQSKHRCDKYDYLAAIACGAIGGIVDIFMVGIPGDSSLGKLTDEQTEKLVKNFARKIGWEPRVEKQDSLASAIGFLEMKYKVNYDQRYSSDVKEMFNMSTRNHHMVSLSHAPDIVGLFFSVLNQFTSTSSFVANGRVITVKTDTFELQGGNFAAKLYCGVANWFGHVLSDIAGSSGSAGNQGRGTGVVMPFYELFRFCDFGKFQVKEDKQDLATIATRTFQEGYDFRHGIALAIPVFLTDLSIRLIWSIRRYFQYKMPLRDCVPSGHCEDLRVMLLMGNGAICVMDGMDAWVRSGGNFLTFFMRLNLVAWCRFATLVIKEVCIRVGLKDVLLGNLELYQQIEAALSSYLQQLEQIDLERFQQECEKGEQYSKRLSQAHSFQEMRECLMYLYQGVGLELPWTGDFDDFMQDKSNRLYF